jgi:hypothetical protein
MRLVRRGRHGRALTVSYGCKMSWLCPDPALHPHQHGTRERRSISKSSVSCIGTTTDFFFVLFFLQVLATQFFFHHKNICGVFYYRFEQRCDLHQQHQQVRLSLCLSTPVRARPAAHVRAYNCRLSPCWSPSFKRFGPCNVMWKSDESNLRQLRGAQ